MMTLASMQFGTRIFTFATALACGASAMLSSEATTASASSSPLTVTASPPLEHGPAIASPGPYAYSTPPPIAREPPPHDPSRPRYTFRAAVKMIPHPDKADKGGEDAYAISPCGRVLGIADGVGGWATQGVDPGLYSKSLMAGLIEHAAQTPHQDPYYYLYHAWKDNWGRLGSSTALVCTVDEDMTFKICNVGDSALAIFRNKFNVFRTTEQTHGWNFPYQLGFGGDDITSSDRMQVRGLGPGDIIVLGTDGVWDNLFNYQIIEAIEKHPGDLQGIADEIAMQAHLVGHDEEASSPFALGSGGRYIGGKLDDVTVIVAEIQVTPPESIQARL